MQKRISLPYVLTLMLITSALTCLITGAVMIRLSGGSFAAGEGSSKTGGSSSDPVTEYSALLNKIEEVYIGEFDKSAAAAEAMRAVVDSLGDVWSYYMTPDEYASYLDRANNRYAGIGVGVATNDAGMAVLYVYKGSPAETAGIVAGDVITEIDGTSIAGMSLDEITRYLARPIGDEVGLVVLRADGASQSLTVVYEYIFIDPVYSEMLDGNIGYIVIANFDTGAANSFITAANDLIAQGATAFVFDVRSNPGGMVKELTDIFDYLLPEGDTFVMMDKDGVEKVDYRSDAAMIDLPAVVLVDSNSYSAAEYFAAMLHEYGYAETVGEQTTGKNRMQMTFTLPGGGALHISTSQYLTKNRVSLYDIGGYTPDHIIPLSEEDYALLISGKLEHGDDEQMLKALELLGAAP